MARDQDRNEQFEWVNAWAEATKVQTPSALKPEAVVSAAPGNASDVTAQDSVAAVAQTAADDQLTRDIAEIERARDALAALPVGSFSARRRTQALTLVPSRTADSVPIIIGGVLALVMLTVFGAAAAMTKLTR